jgi:hypothetical protein
LGQRRVGGQNLKLSFAGGVKNVLSRRFGGQADVAGRARFLLVSLERIHDRRRQISVQQPPHGRGMVASHTTRDKRAELSTTAFAASRRVVKRASNEVSRK